MAKKITGSKVFKGIAIPALVVTSVVPAVSGVPTAHAASGKWQGDGYYLNYMTVSDTEIKFTNITVSSLTGAYSVKIPEEINGYKVVDFDASAFETLSNQAQYNRDGVYPKDYLSEVLVPNPDIKMSGFINYDRNFKPVKYKTTLDSGIDVYYAYQYSGVIDNSLNNMALWSDYSAKPITVDKFVIPEKVFGMQTRYLAEFKGMTIGELVLPTTFYTAVPDAFTKNTIVNKLDTRNLTSPGPFRANFINFGGAGSELILGQNVLNNKYGYYPSTPSTFTGTIDKLEFADDVTDIKNAFFEGGTTVKNIEFNEGLKSIRTKAFKGVKGLEALNLPSTLTTIDADAFNGVKGLKELIIPSSVTSIGANAFSNMGTFNQLVLPKALISVDVNAFNTNTWFNEVVVLNKYLKYPTGSLPFGITTTGVILGHVGSTTETAYMGKGFIPLEENLKEPTITSSLIAGESYKGEVTPIFTVQYADKVTYTLDGNPYDGSSKITGGGQHTLEVVASNELFTTKRLYSFNIAVNNEPIVIGSIPDKKIKNGDILTVDLTKLFSDPDGDKLSFEATTSDDHTSEVWVNAKGELKFTSKVKDSYEVSVKATDGTNYSEPITFMVDVEDAVVTPPVNPKPPVIEDNGQVGVGDLEKSFSEVINVSMIGLNKEKVINLGGLINILNLDNPTVTLSNTNSEAVSYEFNPDDKTIKLKNQKEGFSNIQVVAQSGMSKVVILLMVDSYDSANWGLNYIGNGPVVFPGAGVLNPVGHATLTQGESFEHVDGTKAYKIKIMNNAPFNSCNVHILAQVETL
ncbi:leucine-rich repeat domain-containing protein [Lysinibacillus sp. RC79]|uniref:leucine-rich repeat domain-containing protein n=1 Tax=Lysinibacillus sp. RC79 TaxID=3156296 RepID=UPI003515E325